MFENAPSVTATRAPAAKDSPVTREIMDAIQGPLFDLEDACATMAALDKRDWPLQATYLLERVSLHTEALRAASDRADVPVRAQALAEGLAAISGHAGGK